MNAHRSRQRKRRLAHMAGLHRSPKASHWELRLAMIRAGVAPRREWTHCLRLVA